MFAQRAGVSGLRQVAKPNVFFNTNLAARLAPLAMQTRQVATAKVSESDAQALLAAQRKARPVSPHMEIYDPTQVFFGASIWTRITGAAFSGGLYAYATAYLVAPLFGWHLESASLVAAFGDLPGAVKGGLKFLLAWPFVFHAGAGTRHFIFDSGRLFSKKAINKSGTVLFWGSMVTALGMVAFL